MTYLLMAVIHVSLLMRLPSDGQSANVSSIQIEYAIRYRKLSCNDVENCPQWTYCDPYSSECRPCRRCLGNLDHDDIAVNQCPLPPTHCVESMTSLTELIVCRSLEVVPGHQCSGECRLMPTARRGSPLGTQCSLTCGDADGRTRQQNIMCRANNFTAFWSEPLMFGFKQNDAPVTSQSEDHDSGGPLGQPGEHEDVYATNSYATNSASRLVPWPVENDDPDTTSGEFTQSNTTNSMPSYCSETIMMMETPLMQPVNLRLNLQQPCEYSSPHSYEETVVSLRYETNCKQIDSRGDCACTDG